MSQCDSCSSPGHCCKAFRLNHDNGPYVVWKEPGWEQVAQDYATAAGMPFFHPLPIGNNEVYNSEGREYFSPSWSCERLGLDGRCTQYEDRPQLCRSYQPLSDTLCIMFKETT